MIPASYRIASAPGFHTVHWHLLDGRKPRACDGCAVVVRPAARAYPALRFALGAGGLVLAACRRPQS